MATFRLTPEVKQALRDRAHALRMSENALVNSILGDALRDKLKSLNLRDPTHDPVLQSKQGRWFVALLREVLVGQNPESIALMRLSLKAASQMARVELSKKKE